MLTILEWAGVITALIYVYLATKANRRCFIFGLISSVIFVYICGRDKLYFDTAINVYYVIMSILGWQAWKPTKKGVIEVRAMKSFHYLALLILGATVTLALAYIMSEHTDASMPYVDSFTTVFAVLATWMMVKRYVENWLIWIVADGGSIYLYVVKEHIPMALLFVVYTVIAAFGYAHWKQLKKMQS